MRQDKFTEQAQEALSASQQLVRQFKHSQWDVEHILLALLQQEKGLVGEILKELKINAEDLREKVSEATNLRHAESRQTYRNGGGRSKQAEG